MCTYLGLLSLLEESLLGLLLSLLLLGEVVGSGDLLEGLGVNTADVDTGAGGDHVTSVDTAEGDTVDLEGTGDEENTLLEVLEENDTLSTEAAGEEDQNGTGLEALADLSGTDSLADLYVYKITMSECLFQFLLAHFEFRGPDFSKMRFPYQLMRYRTLALNL